MQNVIVEDLQIQSSELCIASYLIDMFYKHCFPVYGSGYWSANLQSLSLFCTYPNLDRLIDLFETNNSIANMITNCSVVTVRQTKSEDFIRIFLHSIPPKLKSEPVVLVTAKLANFYYNFSMNIKYVEHNLKCNLSTQLWTDIIRCVGFFSVGPKLTPTFNASVFFQLTQHLIDMQFEALSVSEELAAINPTFGKGMQTMKTYKQSESLNKLRQAFRIELKFDIDAEKEASQDSMTINEKSHSFEEDHEDGEEEELQGQEEESDSFSQESSDDEEEDEVEELGTIEQIDKVLGGEEFSRTRAFQSDDIEPMKKSAFNSKLRASTKRFVKKGTHNSADNERNIDKQLHSSISSNDSGELKIQKTISSGPVIVKNRLAEDNTPTAQIELIPKRLERRNVLNDARLKKVNFSERFKLVKLTNLNRTEQIIKTVSKEDAKEWDDFDIYAADNRFGIKDVISTFIKNFKNNMSLNIGSNLEAARELTDFNKRLTIKNNFICKKKLSKKSATLFVPSMTLASMKTQKATLAKIKVFFFQTLDQIINSQIALTSMIEINSQQQLSLVPRYGAAAQVAKGRLMYSTSRALFAGESIDQDSVEYLSSVIHKHILSLLSASCRTVMKQSFRITFLLDVPGLVLVADSSMFKWMVALVIYMMCIKRRFQFIKLTHTEASPGQTTEKLKAQLKDTITETLLQGARFTVTFDFTGLREQHRHNSLKIRETLDLVDMIQRGQILSEYPSEFFQVIIMTLRKEDFILAMPYDQLIRQIRKTIQTNISFMFILPLHLSLAFNSFCMENYPNVFYKFVKFHLPDIVQASRFSESCHAQLFKHIAGTVDSSLRIPDDSNLKKHRLEENVKTLHTRVQSLLPDLKAVYSRRKETKCTVTQEKFAYLVDLGLAFGVHSRVFDRAEYEELEQKVREFISRTEDWSRPESILEENSLFLHEVLSGVALPKLLHVEEGINKVIAEGVFLQAHEANLLSLLNIFMMDEFNFIPLVYDPLGLARAYFKNRTTGLRNEKSKQYFELTDKTEELFVDRIENGTSLILSMPKIGDSTMSAVLQLIQALSIYFLGKDLGYYQSKSKSPATIIGKKKVKMHDSFTLTLLIQRKKDFMRLVEQIKLTTLTSMIKVVAFPESVSTLFANSTPLVRHLEYTVKLNEWFNQTCNYLSSEKSLHLFNHQNDLPAYFQLSELTATKSTSFNRSDELRVTIDFMSLFDQLANLNAKDSSKLFNIFIDEICVVTVQFKTRSKPETPFERTYQEKFLIKQYKELSVSFKKVVFYFSKIRQDAHHYFDAHYFASNLRALVEKCRDYLQNTHHSKSKFEDDLTIFEVDAKYGVGILSDKFARMVEREYPTFWSQLVVAFVHHCARVLGPRERKLFEFWIWVNHTTGEGTNFDKLLYSSTFYKRNTVLTQTSPSKTLNTEAELETRDFRILFSQNHELFSSIESTITTPSPRGKSKHLEESLQRIFGMLKIGYQKDNFASHDPFPLKKEVQPQDADSRSSLDERIEAPPSLVLVPRKPNSSHTPPQTDNSEQQEEARQISSFAPASKTTPQPAGSHKEYKKSRFAAAGRRDLLDASEVKSKAFEESNNNSLLLRRSDSPFIDLPKQAFQRKVSLVDSPLSPDNASKILQRKIATKNQRFSMLDPLIIPKTPGSRDRGAEEYEDEQEEDKEHDEEESIESQIRRNEQLEAEADQKSENLKGTPPGSKEVIDITEEMIISPMRNKKQGLLTTKTKGEKSPTKKKLTFNFDNISPKFTLTDSQTSHSPLRQKSKAQKSGHNESRLRSCSIRQAADRDKREAHSWWIQADPPRAAEVARFRQLQDLHKGRQRCSRKPRALEAVLCSEASCRLQQRRADQAAVQRPAETRCPKHATHLHRNR